MQVTLQTLPKTHVAYMRQVGPYGIPHIPALWQRFASWAATAGLMSPPRTMYGISLDSPEITAPERCRYDACIEVDANFAPNDDVETQTLPGGLYACAAFTGSAENIYAAWVWLCGEWLSTSGYRFDDRPAFELYGPDFAMDPATGRFSCQLCIPVHPL